MEKAGGRWTVFQRRMDGTVNFYQDWELYKHGFGSLNTEFWLGNEKIYYISLQGNYTLRIDLEDFENNTRYAEYTTFTLGPESDGYRLLVTGYSGNAGDSMEKYQNGSKFSTKDVDNDVWPSSCAITFGGAWWYGACHESHLNGRYYRGTTTSFADGVVWHRWKGPYYSLKTTAMMIRRN